ncbi:MAG: hypothetical protein AAGD09_13435 [Cyanobacteria bacterium P01_F01_bin.56]
MSLSLSNRYTLMGLVSSLALVVTASPSWAQLDVTGGGAVLNDVDIFVPTDGTINNSDVPGAIDTRAVIYNSTLDDNTLLIETNQGNIPADAIFRINTLPTINTAGNGEVATEANLVNNFVGSEGDILGTLSFRAVGPGGAQFFNIPTEIQFEVLSPDTLMTGGNPFTEYRAENFILQETGFVTSASGVGVVQRRTPVTLVQYQADPNLPDSQVVLGNFIPSGVYDAERAGASYEADSVELTFEDGIIFSPPEFTLGSTANGDDGFGMDDMGNMDDMDDMDDMDNMDDTGSSSGGSRVIISRAFTSTSRVESISIFNDIAIINLPSFDDIEFDDDLDAEDDLGDDDLNEDDLGDDDLDEDALDEDGLVGGIPDGDDSDDEGNDDDDDDDDDDDGIVVNPNDGSSQFRPVLPVRFIAIGVFVFNNVPSGRWVDPPAADGFEYTMTPRDIPVGVASRIFPGMTGVGEADDAVFTRISGFPIGVDADDTFEVSVDGVVLGEFSPGDILDFNDYADELGDRLVDGGVAQFTVSEINPAVDSSNPVAFPLRVDFSTPTASFEMRALEATAAEDTTQEVSQIVE